MEVPKDIYEKIANYGSDKDVLLFLSVNKTFNDDEFFHRVLLRRYPLLISFKKPDMSWKKLYIEMVYYIAKLEEDYEIPYIPDKDFNPKFLYKYMNRLNMYNYAMFSAAKIGDMKTVKLMIEKSIQRNQIPNFGGGVLFASEGGNMDIINLMIEKAKEYDQEISFMYAIYRVREKEYPKVVNFLIEKAIENKQRIDVDYLNKIGYQI